MSIPSELIIAVLSAVPIIELRGAIPLAMTIHGMSWLSAFVWSLVGNILIAVLLLVSLRRLFEWSSHRWYRLNRLLVWASKRAHRNHSERVERLEGLALFLIVAIPLPLTGAWTGALIATVMGFSVRRSLFPIIAGVIVAGVIVTALTTGIINLL